VALLERVRVRVLGALTDGLLGRDLLRDSGERTEDTEAALASSAFAAEQLIAFSLPGVAADGAAVVVGAGLASVFLPPRLLALGAASAVLAGLLAWLVRRAAGRAAAGAWSAYEPVAAAVHVCVAGGVDVVGNGQAERVRAAAHASALAYVRASRRSDFLAGLSGRVPVLAAILATFGAVLWGAGDPDPVRALGDAVVVASVLPALAGLVQSTVELARGAPTLAPLAKLVLGAPDARHVAGVGDVPRFPAPITWDAVTFAYAGGEPVLSRVSARLVPGRLLVVAGPNGAGKSTLLRLAIGLGAPSSGTVRVDETPLTAVDVQALRRSVAYVPQPPFFPPRATVEEAMRLLAPDASRETLESCLDRLGVLAKLRALRPDAPLSVAVLSLSAGERQRVALARALAQDARVLLLDEPDANLDAAGVALLVPLLRELCTTHQVAVVAHTEVLLDAADDLVHLGGPRPARAATTP